MSTRQTRLTTLSLLTATLLLGACASYDSSWTPVVDHSTSKKGANLQRDLVECRALAKQSADATSEAAKSAGIGALIGAAGGAAIGAMTGGAGTGAAVGAISGGVGGAAQGGLTADQQFKNAYASCLRNRGHAVVQ